MLRHDQRKRQNGKKKVWQLEREGATKQEGGGCMEVRRSRKLDIGKLFIDWKRETERLEIERLGSEL